MGSILIGTILLVNVGIIAVWSLDRTQGKTEETLAERYRSIRKALW